MLFVMMKSKEKFRGQRMGICYVIGAGDFGDGEPVKKPGDCIIAVDAGYRYCKERNLEADLVVGDFDSLGSRPDHPHVLCLRPEKDETDMMVAIEEGIRRGYNQFVIYGGTGGRISHTLANVQVMTDLAARGAEAILVGIGCRMMILQNGEMCFGPENQGYLSIFCCGDRAVGVTEEGLKYSLDRVVLVKENPVGVSNEFAGKPSKVAVEEGTLLIVLESY